MAEHNEVIDIRVCNINWGRAFREYLKKPWPEVKPLEYDDHDVCPDHRVTYFHGICTECEKEENNPDG